MYRFVHSYLSLYTYAYVCIYIYIYIQFVVYLSLRFLSIFRVSPSLVINEDDVMAKNINDIDGIFTFLYVRLCGIQRPVNSGCNLRLTRFSFRFT